jgi:hypothetical protein
VRQARIRTRAHRPRLATNWGDTVGKKLDHDQFAAYARAQILDAQAILDVHRSAGIGLCSCGRQQECSVVIVCTWHIAHYRHKLAILGITQPLPLITTTPGR